MEKQMKRKLRSFPAAAAIAAILSAGSPAAIADGYCDPNVAKLQVGAAQAKIEEQSKLALSSVGFSTLSGKGVQDQFDSNAPRGRYANMSCLEKLFNSGMDIFFRPPSIDNLFGKLQDFVCDQANAVYAQITAPLSSNIYETVDMGGFFPGLNLGSLGGGVNARVRPGMEGATKIRNSGAFISAPSNVLKQADDLSHLF